MSSEKLQGSIKRHVWTETDDVVALYLYKYGAQRLPLREAAVAKWLGIPEGSLARRQSNFQYLDSGQGLSHFAKQSERIYKQHRNTPENTLRLIVLDLIS